MLIGLVAFVLGQKNIWFQKKENQLDCQLKKLDVKSISMIIGSIELFSSC